MGLCKNAIHCVVWRPECEIYRLPEAILKRTKPGRESSSSLYELTVGRSLISDVWEFLIYRRMPAPIGSSDWTYWSG